MTAPVALVTGGTGFIGRRLVARLLAAGVETSVVVRPGSAAPAGTRAIVVADFAPAALQNALAGIAFDRVFNLAATGVHPGERDGEAMFRVNVDATRRLVTIAAERGVRAFVHAGSSAEYADDAIAPYDPGQPLQSYRLYGASKAAASLTACAMAASHGVPLAVLRLYNIYGPGEAPHRLLPSLIAGLSRGRRVPLSAGTQLRDFVHVDDAAEAMLAAANAIASTRGSIIDVCTGHAERVRAFAEKVATAMDADPRLLGFGDLPMRADDIAEVRGNPAAMRRNLPDIKLRDLDAGIAASVRDLLRSR